MRKIVSTLMFVALVATFGYTVSAQTELEPTVIVSDQVSTEGTVLIERAVSDGPGFVVIHTNDGGTPGEVIGWRAVNPGENINFRVPVDFTRATSTLFAMLHYDNSVVGEYEFDGTEGIDGPVAVDAGVIAPFFQVDAISTRDRFVNDDNTVEIDAVVASENGWLVVHMDNGEGAPGPVLGVTFVEAGLNTNVPVTLDGEITNTLFPMLHADTGELGTYEFGAVAGEDMPVVVDGVAATADFKTVPNVVATQQIVIDTFVADWVLSDGPGWLVVHANNNGAPGEVIGAEFVRDGYNEDVAVSLNTDAELTPVMWPMLHTDTGEVGTYEFGEVEGADAPVSVDGEVMTFPMLTANGMTGGDQPNTGNLVTVATVLIDAPGWLAIHADDGEGAPGPVIGTAPLLRGLNNNVSVLMDEGDFTETVYPMLHYDTGEAGVYEFGEVDGADLPVTGPDGSPIVLPITFTNTD